MTSPALGFAAIHEMNASLSASLQTSAAYRTNMAVSATVSTVVYYGNAVYLKKDITHPQNRLVAIKSTIICIAAGLDELAYEVVLQAKRNQLITVEEANHFNAWLRFYKRSTSFWYRLSSLLAYLPGRQTLGRWLGLWSNALQGRSDTGSDANSWNRKISW
jgi:hypothetical protein